MGRGDDGQTPMGQGARRGGGGTHVTPGALEKEVKGCLALRDAGSKE
jgi:hypothetical protein